MYSQFKDNSKNYIWRCYNETMSQKNYVRILSELCALSRDRLSVVAVSGGADSLFVFDVLRQNGYPCVIAHFNHHLRPEADAEAFWVQEYANQLNFKVWLGEADVAELAASEHWSLEEAARKARYSFLFGIAEKLDAQAVITGHHADDQVETVLMHFLRGSGLDGLCGMSYRTYLQEWSQRVPLVRPLLSTWREEINAYFQNSAIIPREDQTNQDISYLRNRVRLALIPYLQQYNPQIKQRIWELSQTLTRDADMINREVQRTLSGALLTKTPEFWALSLQKVQEAPGGVQARIIREAVGNIRSGANELDSESIERALGMINDDTQTGQVDLAGRMNLSKDQQRIYIAVKNAQVIEPQWPWIDTQYEIQLDIPFELQLENGWVLSIEQVEMLSPVEKIIQTANPFEAWLDMESINKPLMLRSRRSGDRFQPLGLLEGSVKISDFMTNVKLPRAARDHWPLVCSDDEIIWVPGYRPAHPVRIKENTRLGIHLVMKQTGDR